MILDTGVFAQLRMCDPAIVGDPKSWSVARLLLILGVLAVGIACLVVRRARRSALQSGDLMTTLVIRRIWIDKAECTGHGLCVPEAASLLEYSSAFRFSFVRNEALKHTQQELALLLAASEVCPCALSALRPKTDVFIAFQTIDRSAKRSNREIIVGRPRSPEPVSRFRSPESCHSPSLGDGAPVCLAPPLKQSAFSARSS